MGTVIPACQLLYSVITIRCDGLVVVPHADCSAAEHPLCYEVDIPMDSAAPYTCSVPSTITSVPSIAPVNLNIERGMDQLGPYIRLSFSDSAYSSVDLHLEQIPSTGLCSSAALENNHAYDNSFSLANAINPFPMDCERGNNNFFTSIYTGQPSTHDTSTFEGESFDLPTYSEVTSMFNASINESTDLQSCDQWILQDINLGKSTDVCTEIPPSPLDVSIPFGIHIRSLASRSKRPISRCSTDAEALTVVSSSSGPYDSCIPESQSETQAGMQLARTTRSLSCPHLGCRRRFKTAATLAGHMKTHLSKGNRFTCSYPPCTEKFSRRHDQLRHEVYKHGKRCKWVCTRCNSFFSYERSLDKHSCSTDKSRRGLGPNT